MRHTLRPAAVQATYCTQELLPQPSHLGRQQRGRILQAALRLCKQRPFLGRRRAAAAGAPQRSQACGMGVQAVAGFTPQAAQGRREQAQAGLPQRGDSPGCPSHRSA